MSETSSIASIRRVATHPATWIAVAAVVLQVCWQLLDHRAPSYDQSSYLTVAQHYVDTIRTSGPDALPREILTFDPNRAPLYPLLLAPLLAVFGSRVDAALVLGLILLPVLVAALAHIARVLGGRRAVVPTVMAAITMPIIYGLARDVLTDFLLTTITAVAIVCAIESRGLRDRRWSLALAACLGLAMLTKVTAPAFVVLPCLVALTITPQRAPAAVRATPADSDARRTQVANLLLGAALLVVSVAWWYVPNRTETASYIRSTTSGELSLGAGPDDPIAVRSVVQFLAAVVNRHVSVVPFAIIALATLLAGRFLVARLRRPDTRSRDLRSMALLGAWALPILVIGLGPNQDVRLAVAGIPAIAVAVGCTIAVLPPRRAAVALWPPLAFAVVSMLVVTFGGGWASARWSIDIPYDEQVIVGLDADLSVYASAPIERNHAHPVVAWIAERADQHGPEPIVVGLLQSHPEINPNSLRWQSTVAGLDGVTYVEVLAAGLDDGAFAAQFDRYDAILFIPDIVGELDDSRRLRAVNQDLAVDRVTADELDAFAMDETHFEIRAPGTVVRAGWRTDPG